jgi:hypothetical protein
MASHLLDRLNYLSVVVAKVFVMQTPKALESSRPGQVPVNEGLLWDVDLALLGRRQPLGHDVGVGERAVGHGREEEEGRRGEAVHLHLHRQTLDQVVDDA